jgi:hypothetical protein
VQTTRYPKTWKEKLYAVEFASAMKRNGGTRYDMLRCVATNLYCNKPTSTMREAGKLN